MDAHQLGENDPDHLAAGCQMDAQQFLDGLVPGDFIGNRRDVVHPVDNGDILVEIEMLTQLLETGVQKTDVWCRLEDHLTVQVQNQAQRGVGGRVLGTEVQGPQTFALLNLGRGNRIGQFQWHGRGVPQDSSRANGTKWCRSPIPRKG